MAENSDNPFRPPQSNSDDYLENVAAGKWRPAFVMQCMACLGILQGLVASVLVTLNFLLAGDRALFEVGWLLVSFSLLGFWSVMLRTAIDLNHDFLRHQFRARLCCLVASILLCPLTTLPAVYVLWHINQRRLKEMEFLKKKL